MAGRGSRPGERRGGRQKGTPNKASLNVLETLVKMGHDPIVGMAKIASGDVPCLVCRGIGEVQVIIRPGKDGPAATVVSKGGTPTECVRCIGSGIEPIPYDLRGNMDKELAQYVAPKRKAVEMSGPDGTPVQVETISRPGKVSREEWIRQREKEISGA